MRLPTAKPSQPSNVYVVTLGARGANGTHGLRAALKLCHKFGLVCFAAREERAALPYERRRRRSHSGKFIRRQNREIRNRKIGEAP